MGPGLLSIWKYPKAGKLEKSIELSPQTTKFENLQSDPNPLLQTNSCAAI